MRASTALETSPNPHQNLAKSQLQDMNLEDSIA